MILTSHIIISGILGSQTQNYFLAALIGLVSHYVLDAIPHWDYLSDEFESGAKSGKNFMKKKKFWLELAKIGGDALAGFILLFIFTQFYQNISIIPAIIGGFFGVLPDALSFLYWMTGSKFIKWNYDIQQFVHNLTAPKTRRDFLPGTITQISAIAAVLFVILKF